MSLRSTHATTLSLALLSGTIACGSNGSQAGSNNPDSGSGTTVIEMFSWWTAPGEAQALQALVSLDEQTHLGDIIYNAALTSGADSRATLKQRLAAGNPPDLFQDNAATLGAFLTANPGVLQPLDAFLATQNLTSVIFPQVLKDVSVGGHVQSMPNNIHRENAFFYNKKVFASQGLAPPTTLAEFLAVCEALKAAGIPPVAIAYQGWIMRILFNDLAMASMGTAAFYDYMTGGPRDDAALKAAIDLFGTVVANYVDTTGASDSTNFGWDHAAAAMQSGKAAMFLHGDWAKGYFQTLGWTPGIDFGVSGMPGASDLFWYGVDTFSLPVGAKHPDGTYDFFQTIGSIDAQVAFNSYKGSTPIRMDIPLSRLDSEAQVTYADFKNASYSMLTVSKDVWDTAMLAFAQNGDKAALFQVFVDTPPVP
jgi:glucose/mannose transport system substrate-binding protein